MEIINIYFDVTNSSDFVIGLVVGVCCLSDTFLSVYFRFHGGILRPQNKSLDMKGASGGGNGGHGFLRDQKLDTNKIKKNSS